MTIYTRLILNLLCKLISGKKRENKSEAEDLTTTRSWL
jgi:hypothetical protein